MADNKEAVWSEITFRQPVDDILKHGPGINVLVSATDGGPRVKVLAQIDTGAAATAISKPLALHLKLKKIGEAKAHQAGLAPIICPLFRVKIALPPGDIEIQIVGLATLDPPHDVLIGRDVLALCRLNVDFTKGTTTLHIQATD